MAMLRHDAEQKKWQDYIASVLWSVGRMLGGEEYPFPDYAEYTGRKKTDTRTSEEIVSGLIDKLTA